MTESDSPLSTLLVEDDPTDALLVRSTLETSADPPFLVTTATTLAECRAHLASSRFDVLLLDLNLPDSRGLPTLESVCSVYPDLAVLVFTGLNDRQTKVAALRAGAQDYLDKGQLQTVLLGRLIRYAVERFALTRAGQAEMRSAELRSVAKLAVLPGTAVTGQIYSSQTLRESYPREFQVFTRRYQALVESALRHRIYKNIPGVSESIRELANDLAAYRCGPRDVIETHTEALRRLIDNDSPSRAQAYIEEGRLLVLEFMGCLASHYRLQAQGSPLSRPQSEKPSRSAGPDAPAGDDQAMAASGAQS